GITLTNDKQLHIGKIDEQLKEVELEDHVKVPQHLTKEASAYYPAFYTFLDKVFDHIVFDKIDEDLPTIEDEHQNQIVIDRIRNILSLIRFDLTECFQMTSERQFIT